MPTKRLTSPRSRKRLDISSPNHSPNPKKLKPSESNALVPRKSPRSCPTMPGKLADFTTADSRSTPKKWTDVDEIALLKGVLAFRNETGAVPSVQTIDSFFDSIKDAVSAPLGPSQAYSKIRRLKALHLKNRGSGPTPHDGLIYKLCSEIWGVNVKKDEDGDGEEKGARAVDYPHLSAFMNFIWKDHPCLSSEFLDEGLKIIDPEKAMELEVRVMEHSRGVARIQMRRFELCQEVLKILRGP